MIIKLLDNTRKINKLLQDSYKNRIEFDDFIAVIAKILGANILVTSVSGKVLASYNDYCDLIDSELITYEMKKKIDASLNDRLLNILSTKENVNLQTLGFRCEDVAGLEAMIIPVDMASKRLASLFIYRKDKSFFLDDIIIGEYASTVIGLEMTRSIKEEESEKDRKALYVKSAINNLSYSEQLAISHIFEELSEKEGILVASKVADKYKITRSVIVNAIRKCESAGVIESKSLGMKGTYIKIINEYFLDEVRKIIV